MNRQERRKAAATQPPAERLRQAQALFQAGKPQEAAAQLRTLLRQITDIPLLAAIHRALGNIAFAAKNEAEAAQHFRKATQLAPDHALTWSDLGTTLAILGDLPAAESALTRATTLNPALGEAQRHLAALRTTPPTPQERATLTHLAETAPPADQIELHFALGRYADQRGEHDLAFAHFTAGNTRLRATQPKFDRARLQSDIDKIIAAFPATAYAPTGNPTQQPVFIVGMPRAGSSLVEQILAAHPEITGIGEHFAIGHLSARLGWSRNPRWTPDSLRHAAQHYLSTLPKSLRAIDKMLDNIFQLGLIATLFPNARIIFCAREPRDIAISCYFQRFAQPYGFDTDLADCLFRIAQLERLTAHWRATLPLQHLTLTYETLLANPEAEARRLITFLGLAWHPGCLAFHTAPRPVRTASWAQVRKPLYNVAIARWRHYEKHFPDI